jgi:hypothetical protein
MVNENSSPTLGLSTEERVCIKAATVKFPAGWHITLENTESCETYARVVPPWDVNASAFLLDRERHGLVLTDNLSDQARPVISPTCDVRDAMDQAANIAWAYAIFRAALRDLDTTTRGLFAPREVPALPGPG